MKRIIIFHLLITMSLIIYGQDKCEVPNPFPKEISDCINKGKELYSSGKFSYCAKNYDFIISKYPNYCFAYYNRGIAKYYADDINGATLDLEHAALLGMTDAIDFMIKHDLEADDKRLAGMIAERTKKLDEEQKQKDAALKKTE